MAHGEGESGIKRGDEDELIYFLKGGVVTGKAGTETGADDDVLGVAVLAEEVGDVIGVAKEAGFVGRDRVVRVAGVFDKEKGVAQAFEFGRQKAAVASRTGVAVVVNQGAIGLGQVVKAGALVSELLVVGKTGTGGKVLVVGVVEVGFLEKEEHDTEAQVDKQGKAKEHKQELERKAAWGWRGHKPRLTNRSEEGEKEKEKRCSMKA